MAPKKKTAKKGEAAPGPAADAPHPQRCDLPHFQRLQTQPRQPCPANRPTRSRSVRAIPAPQ